MRNSGEAWRGKSRWGHDFILVARKIFWADTWAECNERDAMQITGRREIPRQEEWHVKSPSGRSRVGIFKEQWEGQVTMVKRARVHVVEVWSERWEGSGSVGPCSLRQGLRLLFQVWWAARLCIFLIWCCIKDKACNLAQFCGWALEFPGTNALGQPILHLCHKTHRQRMAPYPLLLLRISDEELGALFFWGLNL